MIINFKCNPSFDDHVFDGWNYQGFCGTGWTSFELGDKIRLFGKRLSLLDDRCEFLVFYHSIKGINTDCRRWDV
jgi:hypothetical protein